MNIAKGLTNFHSGAFPQDEAPKIDVDENPSSNIAMPTTKCKAGEVNIALLKQILTHKVNFPLKKVC